MITGLIKPYPRLLPWGQWDGQNFMFDEPFFYVDRKGNVWCIPKGGTTDGPSIPHEFENIISPFGVGIYAGSNFHDNAYRNTLLVWRTDTKSFTLANLSEADSNSLFDEIMDVCGQSKIKRIVVFEGVNWGGKSSYEDDRKKTWPAITVPAGLPPQLIAA